MPDTTAQQPAPTPKQTQTPADARDALWREGTAALQRLTGHTERQIRSLLGRMLEGAGDDRARLLAVLRETERDRRVDPVGWIEAHLRRRRAPGMGRACR